MTNVIAKWPARVTRDRRGRWPLRRVPVRGANDGGSSTGLLIELGRVLAPRLRAKPPVSTRWLVFFDGEEAQIEWSATDSLYGSRALVAALRASGELSRLRALVVADMIGDRDLRIRRGALSTPWLSELAWAVARRLGWSVTFSTSPRGCRTITPRSWTPASRLRF